MAYLYTHVLFGTELLQQAEGPWTALASDHLAAYYCGQLGPDVYFFDRLPPPLHRKHQKKTANLLHNEDLGRLISAMLPLAAESDELKAYLLGFLCHGLLDSNVHPYIDARFLGTDHTRFEMSLEAEFRKRHGTQIDGKELKAVSDGLRQSPETAKIIDRLHVRLTESLFQTGVPGAYARGLRLMFPDSKLLTDPSGRKERILSAAEKLLRIPAGKVSRLVIAPARNTGDRFDLQDPFNDREEFWVSPWAPDCRRNESYPSLYDRAMAEAKELLPVLYAVLCGEQREERITEELEGRTMAHGATGH